MLGFILSKMQMLLFATGIFVVAVLFYGFISGIELKTAAASGISLEAKAIEEQLGGDALCSFKTAAIPDRITYGIGGSQFFYDLTFYFLKEGSANMLIMYISEHGKESIASSKKIPMNYEIVLVDPGFIAEDKPVDGYVYSSSEIPGAKKMEPSSGSSASSGNPSCGNQSCITLYPRSATKGAQASAPNAFVALKEVENSVTTMYVIPCSTLITGSTGTELMGNCVWNILKVGCWKLKQKNPSRADLVPSCFDVTREIKEEGSSVKSFTWKDCEERFYGTTG